MQDILLKKKARYEKTYNSIFHWEIIQNEKWADIHMTEAGFTFAFLALLLLFNTKYYSCELLILQRATQVFSTAMASSTSAW